MIIRCMGCNRLRHAQPWRTNMEKTVPACDKCKPKYGSGLRTVMIRKTVIAVHKHHGITARLKRGLT